MTHPKFKLTPPKSQLTKAAHEALPQLGKQVKKKTTPQTNQNLVKNMSNRQLFTRTNDFPAAPGSREAGQGGSLA